MDQKSSKLIETVARGDIPATRIDAMLALALNEAAPASNEKFYNVCAACEYMGGISRVHLWNLRRRGLKTFNAGGRVLLRKIDMDEFVMGKNK
ncbi:MAG: hypothetical protein WAX69_27235 [Victivallales bacterium]